MTGVSDDRDRTTPDLLSSAIAGDRFALGELWSAWNSSLLRFLRSLRVPEPDDVAAEVWVDLARRMPEFGADPDAFRSMLFTIGRRRAIDARRFRLRRPAITSDTQVYAATVSSDVAVDVQVEGELSVQKLLAKLSRAQAEVVALRVIAGFSAAETAQMTGRREGAVRQMTMRALQELKVHAAAAGFGTNEARDQNIFENEVT